MIADRTKRNKDKRGSFLMNEYNEYSARTVDDAITEACEKLCVTSDRLDYEVVSEGSTGFLGMGVKPAVIKARIKEEKREAANTVSNTPDLSSDSETVELKPSAAVQTSAADDLHDEMERSENPCVDTEKITSEARKFLTDVFHAMNMPVVIDLKFDIENMVLSADLSGEDMGVLIGKRGQTLDSIQYLVSLVVNRDQENYIHVKVDTENYRQRRKATLENLAKNIAYKVRKSHTSVSLEPMNPYERRIIHSALQSDRYVTTHSEGEEPYRRVVVTLKK
jgi:spoIIIJ-associated protein